MKSPNIIFSESISGFKNFLDWRSEEVERQRLINALSRLSTGYLSNGHPRYLATFAHDGNSHLVDVMGRPERWQFDLIMDALKAAGLVRGSALDVGANVGLQSLFLASFYDRILAFEPHPNTYFLLKYNLGEYVPRGEAFNVALSNETGTARLSLGRPGNIGAFSLMDSDPQGEVFEVQTRRLDDMNEVTDVDIGLIKLDVEGAERLVIDGARGTIMRHKPVIVLEDFKTRGGIRSDALNALGELGYELVLEPVFLPLRTRASRYRIVNAAQNLAAIWRHGHRLALIECDYKSPRGYDLLVAVHGSQVASFNIETKFA